MSSIMIVSIIIGLLGALVCFAFVTQTIEKKRKQRQRLLTALKLRSRNFKYMLNGFPPDFLPKELTVLVHRCLVDVCEQLSKLEPKEPLYLEDLQLYSSQMEAIQRKPKRNKRKPLENPQQIKEVRTHLEDLHKFVHQLEKRGTLKKSQTEGFSRQIKQLVLQMSVDAYVHNGKQAQAAGKTRLAIHFFSLAKKLLVRENVDKSLNAQITQLGSRISKLQNQIREEEPEYREAESQVSQKEEVSKAWDEFAEKEEGWKKKRVYD